MRENRKSCRVALYLRDIKVIIAFNFPNHLHLKNKFKHPFKNWKDTHCLLLIIFFKINIYIYIYIALTACWTLRKINRCNSSLDNNQNPIRNLFPFLLHWCQFASTVISSSQSYALDSKLNHKVILSPKVGI